jgi:photosystem II stability/assembly factor-like uncharacterized protein
MATKSYYVSNFYTGYVRKSTDLFATLGTDIPIPSSDSNLEAIMCVPGFSDRVITCGSNKRIYLSNDAGVNWVLALGDYSTTSNNHPIRDLWILDQNISYAVGPDGACMKSINGGATFNLTPTHPTDTGSLSVDHHCSTLHFTNLLSGVVATIKDGEGVFVYKTIDGGDTWTVLNAGLPITNDIDAGGIHMTADQTKIIVVCASGIYTSIDGGVSFGLTQQLLVNSTPIGRHLTRTSDDNMYVTCLYTGFYRSIDQGLTWIEIITPVEFDPDFVSSFFYTPTQGLISTGGELWDCSDTGVDFNQALETAGPATSIWIETDLNIPILDCPHFNIDITGPSCAPDCIQPGSIVQFDLGGSISSIVYPTTISFKVYNKATDQEVFNAEYPVADDDKLNAIIINFIAPEPGSYCSYVSFPGCNTIKALCFDVCEPFDIYKDECNKWHVHRPEQSSRTEFLVDLRELEGEYLITDQLWDTDQDNTFEFELTGDGIYIFEMKDVDTGEVIYSFSSFETCSLQECYMIMMDKIMCSCSDPCCKKCTGVPDQHREFARMTLNKLVPLYLTYLGMARRNELYTTGMKLISDEQICFLHDANQVLGKILEIIEDCGCLCPEQKNTASNRGGCTSC